MSRPRPEATGRYLRELLEMPYTAEQLQIITHPLCPQLVVAGAGSGKTAVMAARVVHLVAFHGVAPAAVLGLTFTNKAAVELAHRVRLALGAVELDGVSPQPDDDEPTVSTYHAYAARLLADHALRIGREPLTTLLTEAGRWQLAVRVVNAATGPFQALEWKPPTVARYLLNLDAEMSEHLVTSAQVRRCDAALRAQVAALDRPPKYARELATAALARDELLSLVEGYRRAKADLDLVDYGDQVALAAEIAIRRPEVGALERARYAVVVLDEYQDTGVAQRLLLAALFSGGAHPVTAVGDPCQSIYGWRGASVGNLLRFPQHFQGPELAEFAAHFLMTSFRNDGRILEVANRVSAPLREPRAGSRRPRFDVPVLTVAPGRDRAGDVRCARHLTVLAEADWVGEEIERAVRVEQVEPGSVAVLCRRRSDFGLLHEELVRRGLPVEVVGLGGLLEMPEVADVVATLEVLAEPTANAALVRLMTGPRWRIGSRDLVALGQHAAALARADAGGADADADADADGERELRKATSAVDPCDVVALTDALDSLRPADNRYSEEGLRRLRALSAELKGLRPLTGQPVVEAVSGVVAVIGLGVEIEAQPVPMATARAANLGAFLDHAAAFAGLDGGAELGAFLAFLEAAGDAEDGLDIGAVAATDTIKLLTVHKAKGLEWDVVVVPGLCEDVFPSRQGRSLWTRAAKVLPYQLRGDCADLPADPELTGKGIAAFKELCRDDELEEERRLAYVAVTRARHRLLASGYHWGLTQANAKEVSPFLQEIHDACVAGAGTVGTWIQDAGESNPLTGAAVDVAWPAPYEPLALSRRRAAAQAVREALAADGERPDGESSGLSEGDREQLARWRTEAGLLLAELAVTSGTDRQVPLPRSLTASQVVRLAVDPAGLARSLARPMPARPNPAARRGTRFHAWVEHLFDERPLFDTESMPGAADAEVPGDDELAALRAAFARSPYAGMRPHAVEAPFELYVAGRLVRGRIDAVYRTPDGFEVIDYKTGLSPRAPAAAALQLAVYRLAWAGVAGVPLERVGAGFLYVRTGEVVRPPDLPDLAGLGRLLSGPAA